MLRRAWQDWGEVEETSGSSSQTTLLPSSLLVLPVLVFYFLLQLLLHTIADNSSVLELSELCFALLSTSVMPTCSSRQLYRPACACAACLLLSSISSTMASCNNRQFYYTACACFFFALPPNVLAIVLYRWSCLCLCILLWATAEWFLTIADSFIALHELDFLPWQQ